MSTSVFSERTREIELSQTRRLETAAYLQFIRGLLLRRPLDELGAGKAADYLRAAVASGNLDALKNTAASFVATVDQATLIGSLLPLAVPAAVNVPLLDVPSEVSASLVADGMPVPVQKLDVSSDLLPPMVLKSLFVFNQRVLDSANPQARRAFDNALIALLRASWDTALVAYLTDHAARASGSGGSLASDLAEALGVLSNGRPRTPIAITSPRAAAYLASSGGIFETIKLDSSGHLIGMPCLISAAAGNALLLVDGGHFAMSDGGVVIESGGSAALEMSDTPSNSVATGSGTSLVSMWQMNSLALRVQRWISWSLLTPDAAVSLVLADLAGSPQ